MRAFSKVAFGGVSPLLAVARGVARAPDADGSAARAGADGFAGLRSPALRAGALAEPGTGHHGARTASGLERPRGLAQSGSRPDAPTTPMAPVGSGRDAAAALVGSGLAAASALAAADLEGATAPAAADLDGATVLAAADLEGATALAAVERDALTTPAASDLPRSLERPAPAGGGASATEAGVGFRQGSSPEGWQKPAGEADRSVSAAASALSLTHSPLFSSRSLARGEA